MAFHWRADDGPLIVVFGPSLFPSPTKKKKKEKKRKQKKKQKNAHVNSFEIVLFIFINGADSEMYYRALHCMQMIRLWAANGLLLVQ